ncbi:MAG: hypothetical protein WC208_09620 [Gallionella sp.]|jgi:hypothetical protein
MNPIPAPYRILAMVLLLLAGIAFGFVQGTLRESDRRDALELTKERAAENLFNAALDNGRKHAGNVIAWRGRAEIYYRNWQEILKNENDTQLSECKTQTDTTAQNGVPVVLLSPAWIGLYNAAWLPEFDKQGDTGGTAGEIVETGFVTPREAIGNIGINARLCGEDRKRLDELIDHLKETE